MESVALSTKFSALGTGNQIQIVAFEDRILAGEALKRAEERVRSLHDTLSVFQPESELSLLNASAGCGAVAVGADTLRLLEESKHYSELSGGAFSVTTRALSALWEIHARCGSVPGRAEVEHALSLVCDEDIELDEEAHTVSSNALDRALTSAASQKGMRRTRCGVF